MTGAWSAEFGYYGFSTYSNPADGISFIIHNDPRGLNAVGGGADYLSYSGPSDIAISNSVAVGIDVFNKYMRLGVNGSWVDQIPFSSDMPHLTLLNDKVRCRVAYDGIGTLTVKLSHPQFGFLTKAFDVDIAQVLETDDAYVGFGCGTGGSKGQHMIGGFTLDNGGGGYLPDYAVLDGTASISSGNLAVTLGASQEQRGYQMESLSYADQAELEIISATVSNAQPELSLADQDSWKLLGEAHWLPDGRLANSVKVSDGQGSSYTYDSFDLLSRSWQLSFSFDMGDRTPTAADALHLFMMKDDPAERSNIGPPGDACRFEWRYYYNAPEHPTILRIYTNSVQDLVVPDMAPIDLQVDNTAQMTLSYDRPSDTMTIRTESDAGVYTHVVTNFNLPSTLYNSDVYIGFWGSVGGAQCENIVGDLSLIYTDGEDAENGATHYLAFNELNGSGTLIKSGSGALALPGDVDDTTSNAVIEVREGGVVLAKRSLESATLGGGVRGDWISGYLGEWGKNGSFQVSPASTGARSTAHYGRRICVSRAWTIGYDFFMDDKSNSPADAYCIFVHNDPRGVMALGAGTGNAGYGGSDDGIRNSLAMRWYFYQGNTGGLPNTTEIGWDGIFKAVTRQSFDPIRLANGVTRTVISYDPVVGTLRSVLSNGGSVVTNTYTDVDIAAQVGGDYAWLGFGGGSGGQFCDMCINNLSMTYHEDVPDPTDQSDYLAELIVPAATAAPVYLHRTVDRELNYQIGKVTLNDGATLKVDYAHDSAKTAPATLVAREINFQSVGTIDVQSGARCALLNGSGVDLVKMGGGSLVFAPTDIQPLSYSGSTTLIEGTLLLGGAYLPESTALAVTNGATLGLQFTGKQYVDTLTVDGVECNGGLYSASNTSWIEGSGLLVVRNPAPGTLTIIR
jgi:hypothetical protein